ncbi:amino acid adenylation domain-containing protein, partial [Flavobacterium sp. FlaQc-48]|uniref:amino acid adenylation domain-containing protein n=2 Tax=Flavobacterium sp. FlaQc-48 TaxID=3374181 RepID=UPI0037580E79
MDKILNLLKRAQDQGVRLELEGENLVLKSESENIDNALLADIKDNKDLIIKHLEKFEVNRNHDKGLGKYTVKPFDRDLIKHIPLSYSQERLWFLDQLGGSAEYNMPIVLRLDGALNISILEESLQTIVSRHEVLRTNLLSEEGIGYQEVISAKNWFLEREAVSNGELLESHLNKYLNAPFNLSNDYKLRACLYTLGDEKYVLACVFHHIASDGWSQGILVNEFMELYSALESGRKAVLPELSLQYADYAIWQRNYLEGEVLENQLSYWESKLRAVSTLSLPMDYARPSVQSNAGAIVSLELDKKISASLSSICQEQGVTLFMLLLSAFKVLLSRYSGQDDICVGTPIANRTQSELEGMIGFFVNTLALRSDLSDNPSFKDLLSRIKQTTLEGYDHQLAPFEKVVERVVNTRNMSMTPLFQVLFVLQNTPEGSGDLSLEGVTLSGYEFDMVSSKFDLNMLISEFEEVITLNLEYSTALFDKTTIDRMILHYQNLLQSIISDITQPIDSLSILTKKEEIQLLDVFNDTFTEYPKDKTILDLFSEQVKNIPDAIAVVFEDQALTYKELDQRSNQLSHYLQGQGIITDSLVGICLDRNLEMVIGILGILKSGGAYVPIDPEYPSDRVAYMLKDASIKTVLSSNTTGNLLEGYKDLSILLLDTDWDLISGYSTENLNKVIGPDDLAYVLYTSGSTGKPKGVMMSHYALFNLICNNNQLGISNQRVTQLSSISFDMSFQEIFFAITQGGELYIVPSETKKDLAGLVNFIKNKNIETMFLPTAFFIFLGAEGVFEKIDSVKDLIVAGEQLKLSENVKKYLKQQGVMLHNHYGPTETHVVTTDIIDYKSRSDEDETISIGKPIANTQIYILNNSLNLLPIGVAGELCIGGVQVARGYLNKEELTQEKFIANPFREGERIYKTGDLARWLLDGNIEYIGRKDDQVKIRGFRIELGEIENVLSSLPGITQCCVLAKEDAGGNKRLVGYVVVDKELNKNQIQEYLKLSLPEFMVPMIWIQLESFPLTTNGKLNKRLLPEPDNSDLSSREYVAPRNEIEAQLAEIWQNLLGVERVGVYDNFFELGGHSLLATRLVSMIRKDLRIEVSLREVFGHTTISELGTHISVQSEGVLLPSIVIENRPARIPLSFSQERLWFLDQLQGSTEYHIPIVLGLEGALEVSILEQTLQEIVSRHEVLRTMLLAEDGIGYQEIISAEGWSLDSAIVSDDLSLENNIADYVNKPFDLSKDYKLRACLYTLGNEKYVLACVFHHIASDGWSGGILTNEFMELYSAFQSNKTPDLPELSLQYADYAIWQRKYLEGEVLENQLSYWEAKLSGVSTLSLPTDYVRPSVQSTAGADVSLELNKKISTSLSSICQQEGVTLFMLLLSAFKVLLSRYSGQDDICVGTPIANRTQSELEGMIGFFVNTLALRSDLSDNPSFRDLLSRVKQTTLEGYDHQLTPFEKVVDRVITTRDMSMTPLFQVLFVLQNTDDNFGENDKGLNDITISGYELDTVTSKFDLTFSVSESNHGISLGINYCTALFDKATIDRMLLHYQELLAGIVSNITQPISSLAMLTKEESHQLLDVFNNTDVAYPLDKTIVDLFEEQAKQTPDAIAVVYEDKELTYKELDQRSNQLGHYLREQGVQPDALVGICLERSLEMLVGILGILKSGGAYVPIDPEYPTDRIDYMLKDAGIGLVLSSEISSNVINKDRDLSVLCLDKDWDLISGYSSGKLSTVLSASNLAYVIYTSGSTGTPKGVLITHKNVVRLFKNESSLYDFGSTDVWTLFHSFCFDFSVWEMYGALLHGGRLVIVGKDLTKDAISFKELLIKEGVTVLNQTPGSFYVLQEEFLSESSAHSLRYVIFGGEALNSTYLERWKRSYPDCQLINMYGITETTVHVTYKEILESDTKSLISNIGAAIPTLGCYIVDAHLNLVPIGVEGELCVSGAGVARGYLNREDLTNEKFIENPFSEDKTSRLYRSGDLARWLPDGNIEYIGRKDDQVKIRGYRIELGEIENVLSSLDGVTQCCVLAKEDAGGSKRLVGYVVLEEALDKERLQNQLKLSLPEYMVPQLWVALDAMPLTGNGKLDKKSLPDLDSSNLSSKEYVAPRNETETQLAEIWQNLLGLEQVGINDNFFELGGDSIKSIRLISQINKSFNQHIQLRNLFEYATIQNFSDSVLNSDAVAADDKLKELHKIVEWEIEALRLSVLASIKNPDLIEDVYPMNDVQQGMVMESLVAPELGIFHDQLIFNIEDKSFDITIFHKSLALLIEKHSIFRTSFNFSDYDKPVQIVSKSVSFDLKNTDLSLFDRQAQEKKIEQFLETERGVSFVSEQVPLYRFDLFTIDEYSKLFIFQFHHSIMDGWSIASFITEVYKTYFELKKNISYLPSIIACTHRDAIISELVAKQDVEAISFWKKELSGYKYLDIFKEETEVFEIYNKQYDLTFLNDLQEHCKQYNLTLKTVFFGAYIYALKMLTLENELTVGLVSNNRPSIEDGDNLLGCFLNMLPLRYTFQSEENWLLYFKNVEEKIKEVQINNHLTFFEIKRLTGMNKDDSFYDALFNYIDFHVYNEIMSDDYANNLQSTDKNNLNEDLKISSFERTNSSLSLTVDLTGGRDIKIEYKLFKKFKSGISLERFHTYIDNILGCFKNKFDSPVSTDSILLEEESHQLLNVFNATSIDYPKDKTIVDLFSEQVSKTPNSVAIVFDDQELTYGELDKKSNQLARFLVSKGVEKEDLIGICINRSFEMIIGILGILKSGGAYVPIDPEYPQARIDYMLEDSGIKFLLSDSTSLVTFPGKDNLDIVLLDKDWDLIAQEATGSIERISSPENLAYIIYTSGSTGQPKGVEIRNKSLASRLQFYKVYYDMTSEDKVLFYRSFSFDGSLEEYIMPFTVGGCCVMAPVNFKDDLFQNIIDYIERYQITKVNMPPLLLQNMLDYISDTDLNKLQSLRHVVSGGDKINTKVVNTFIARLGNRYLISLHNSYGPTENTIDSTIYRFENDIEYTAIPIGAPVGNSEVYILDEAHCLVPIGLLGEICVSGDGIARGYLNKPLQTAEKFINHPFRSGEKLYKTGDIGRWMPDGNVEFMGRKDDQVKIRGHRIELGEIEQTLLKLGEVKKAVVLVKVDKNSNKRLVAFLELTEEINTEDLRIQLSKTLPKFMIPNQFIQLEAIPFTSNGKVDKNALPDPDDSELSNKEYAAPRNQTEVQLVEIWQNLLGLEQVGIHDNFFELGGHSLLATRLVSMIRKDLMIEVSIREVFEHTTISELEAHLSAQSEGVLLPTIVAEERPARIPLSFSQERLWFLDQLQGSTEYHVPSILRLEGALEVSILEQTIQEIVSRHEVLRSMLLSEDGIGYQEIISAEGWSLDQFEISDATLLETSLDSYVTQPFNLSKDYKLRSCLYHLGNEQYVLACVFHHIASDGWSEGILVNEFIELYSAKTQGRTPSLPSLPIQYADYAIWQRKYVSGEVLEAQLRYWDNQLRGVLPLLLPTDYVRPSIQSRAGSSTSFNINQEQKVALDLICKSEGVTMFMVLLSAFKVLLYKYSGQEDICVGTPTANRTQAELEGVIGFFINNLTIRTKIDCKNSFKDLLVQVKETTLNAYNNQSAPFEKVVDRVMTTRDTSMSPLFQVKFLLNNTPRSEEVFLDKITIDGYERDNISSILDLSFNALETEKEILFDIEYCTDLFKSDTIESMIIHFEEIISSIIKNINEPISNLEMLSIEEKQQILFEFNNTQVVYPKDKTLVDLFEEQVKRTPNNIAVAFEDEVLTYRELNEQSNCLAYYLKNTGKLESEDIVGVMMNRNIRSIVSMLGIMKSGACYLPIDKDYPSSRKSFIIEDANVKLLIIDSESLFEVMDYDTKIFSIDIEFETISKEVTILDLNNSNVKSSDLAYIIYTSGSTGNPKGVMIEHGSIVNTILSQINTFSVTEADSCLQFASHSFDASISEIFISLLSGSQLYIIEEENKLDVSYFVDYVEKNQISIATLPPAFLTLLDCNQISSIRTLITAGEQAPLKQAKLFAETGKYINAYGPTEVSICATTFSGEIGTIVPIGTPIANTQIYILDDSQNIVPIGVIGELCISGAGLARGYLNRDDLTREKFIANPFIKGERLYKTGDLAQWLPDGNIMYIGRKDNQVKIRGYRIELGEIENALFSLPGIIQCCVLAKEDASGSKRLVGYVVSDDDFDKESIQESLKTKLPDYMVPQLWVVLDSFPLTSNGKVDKKSLPDPDNSDLSSKEYVAPRNETETQLAEIWQNLLGVEQIGIHDNFFELGGHSLLAIRMISLIRKVFEVEISIQEVFEYQSILEISALLLSKDKQLLLPTIVVQERGVRVPLSFSQERLWFLDQLQGTTEYHVPTILGLEGALEVSILEQTLYEIVSRHEVLRSMLLSEDGIGYQEIISAEGWSLDSAIVSDELLLENIITDYVNKPFDLSKDYKLRACLYTLGNEKYVLACVFHHIASDGWSDVILVHEFAELYSALQSGREAVLPELSLQYADYAIWQRKYLEGEVLENQLSYWEEKLKGVSTLSLPTDYVRPVVQSNEGANVSLELGKELRDSLSSICQEEGVTLFMLMLSAFKILLSQYSGQDDICVGTPIANRTQSELEGMIGFFVNTLALRSDLSGNPSFKELLSRVKQTTLEGYDHQLTPFEKVVDRVITTRDMSMSPLFQVMFSLQNNEESKDAALEGVTLSSYDIEVGSSQFDLLLNVSEKENGISLGVNYCTALFDKTTIDRMLQHYQKLLVSIAGNITQPLSNLSMLTKEESHQLLYEFNNTDVAYAKEKTVVDLFAEQVKKTPNAIAVVYGHEELSYKELDQRSNQLGHYLREQGVEPDDLVGICLERSLEMLIGILGILKSGGAYVPIDPEYPTDRIDYMLKDAGIGLVLSSGVSSKVIKEKKDVSTFLLDKDWDLISGYSTGKLS